MESHLTKRKLNLMTCAQFATLTMLTEAFSSTALIDFVEDAGKITLNKV